MEEIRYEVRYSAEFDPIAMRITNEGIAIAPAIPVQVEDASPTIRAGSIIPVASLID